MNKKILLISLLTGSFSFSAQVTSQQAGQVALAANDAQFVTNRLISLADSVQTSITAGNVYFVAGSTQPYSLTAQQNQDILNYYNALKVRLLADYNQLP